ncbi:nitrous oxide-stimulated promoter family protein [Campylobacter rectus]|uniref:nitrous oxide-stimulated promoter family protein n=1 Tax=Campylobacter rectus TaxID=203 RepID=UPI0023F180C5|nr:nitrous oxide-stimulated promoter family protein [Campylobacter rectus]
MTNEKFTEQVTTLAKFLQIYCADKHALAPKREINLELTYKGKNLNDSVRTQLCTECEQLFFYAHERLLACSHDIKPSCRKCPVPASMLRKT